MKHSSGRPTKPSAVVVASGPTARSVTFQSKDFDLRVGMNRGYRFWQEICFEPNVYVCLDPALVEDVIDEIKERIADGRLIFLFLHDAFRELLKFSGDTAEITYLSQVHKRYSRTDVMGKQPEIQNVAFHSSRPSKITTGTWSVRFAWFLGASSIHVIGLDSSISNTMIEMKKETSGFYRVIQSRVGSYASANYARLGDLIQKPEPFRHFGKLHRVAAQSLARDIVRQDGPWLVWPVESIGNAKSIGVTKRTPELLDVSVSGYEFRTLLLILRKAAFSYRAQKSSIRVSFWLKPASLVQRCIVSRVLRVNGFVLEREKVLGVWLFKATKQ